jgi:nucleotide-binding universal stress UspA family protein
MPAQRILVALDGSPLSEVAIPEASLLAKALDADVIVLRIVPIVGDIIESGTMRIAVDEIWAAERDAASQYLAAIRDRELGGLRVEVLVEHGSPADAILDVARRRDVDRIVMTTHGRTGVTRWVLGSVAEKVIRAADRTVVLVRPRAESRG